MSCAEDGPVCLQARFHLQHPDLQLRRTRASAPEAPGSGLVNAAHFLDVVLNEKVFSLLSEQGGGSPTASRVRVTVEPEDRTCDGRSMSGAAAVRWSTSSSSTVAQKRSDEAWVEVLRKVT